MQHTDLKHLWAASERLVELAAQGAPLPSILAEVAQVARQVASASPRSAVYLHGAGPAAPEPTPGGSCWSFPLLAASDVVGTLVVHHDEPRALTRAEMAAMRYLVTIASAAIERDRRAPSAPRPITVRRAALPAAGCRTGEGLESIRRYIAAEQPDFDPTAP